MFGRRPGRTLAIILALAALAGCSTIDFDYPRTESHALTDTDDTELGRLIQPIVTGKPEGESGFVTMLNGIDALAARLMLGRRAEKSIDVQYYLIKNDVVGRVFIYNLLAAADRGVRVRLLVDDMFTSGLDVGLAALDSHPNFEIRIFNPFKRGAAGRSLGSIGNISRINRRMHNKSFTVDNQITIIGGRNIADEYFETGGTTEFLDEDLFVIGAPVDDVSDGFDEYCNSPEAMPMSAFDRMVAHSKVGDSLTVARDLLAEHLDGPFLGNVDNEIIERFEAGTLDLIEAYIEVVQDHPDKVRHRRWRRSYESLEYLMQMVSAAEQEVVIISPYFVPEKQGVDFFATLAKKGVRIVIITNSLASTNHKSVHAVYRRHRKPLLEQGIELYELRPRYEGMSTDTDLTLHSKVLTVDRKRTFVGSFNLDPRSLYLNTELGLAVDSEELATHMATSILDLLPDLAYKLSLSPKGRLQWVLRTGGVEEVITTAPRTSWWLRLRTWLTGLLRIEGQL